MALARACVLSGLLFFQLNCTGQQAGADLYVIADALTSAGQITRVSVTVTPAGLKQDLTVSATDPTKFTGTVPNVPVGTQTVTATAYRTGTDGSEQVVGSGSVAVTVSKNVQVQAQITILDGTGPLPVPDHSPVVTSMVTQLSAAVGDVTSVSATASDADGNPITFAWTTLTGCGTFADPSSASTTFTPNATGTCTLKVTATANGLSDQKTANMTVNPATGSIGVEVDYVPQPEIISIAFSNGATQLGTISRTGADATLHAAFVQGTTYTVTLTYDPWPTGTISLSDTCGGAIGQPSFQAGGTATGTWKPTVAGGPCQLTATLTRQSLTDSFMVVLAF